MITDPNNPSANNFNQGYVQFRDTGIILNVTPRVNPGGLVFMEIKQEQSTPGDPSTAVQGNVAVDKRVIDTEIAVQSGQTVLLGGLMSERQERGRSGIPGLDQIPGVGALFSRTLGSSERTELIIFIRPQIIRNGLDAQRIAHDLRSKMRGFSGPTATAPPLRVRY